MGPDIKAIQKFLDGDLGIGDNFFQTIIDTVLNQIQNQPVDTTGLEDMPDFSERYKAAARDQAESLSIPELSGLKAIEKTTISSLFETLKPYVELIKLILEMLAILEDIAARIGELPNPAYIKGTFNYNKDQLDGMFSALNLSPANKFDFSEPNRNKTFNSNITTTEVPDLPDFTLPITEPFNIKKNEFDKIRENQGTVGKSNQETQAKKPTSFILSYRNTLGEAIDPPAELIEEGVNWFGHFDLVTNPIQLQSIREKEIRDKYEDDETMHEHIPTLLGNIRANQEYTSLVKETQNRKFRLNTDPLFPVTIRIGWWNYKDVEYEGKTVNLHPELEYVINTRKVDGNFLFYAESENEAKRQEVDNERENIRPKVNQSFLQDFNSLNLNERLSSQKTELTGIRTNLNTQYQQSLDDIRGNIANTNKTLNSVVRDLNSSNLSNAEIGEINTKYRKYVSSLQQVSDNSSLYIDKSLTLNKDVESFYTRLIDVDLPNLQTDIQKNADDENKIKSSILSADANKQEAAQKFNTFSSEIETLNADFNTSLNESNTAYDEFVKSLPPDISSSKKDELSKQHTNLNSLSQTTLDLTTASLTNYINFSNQFFANTLDAVGETVVKLSSALQQLKNLNPFTPKQDCVEAMKDFGKVSPKGPPVYKGGFWIFTAPVIFASALIPKIIEIIKLITSVISVATNPTKLFDLLFEIIRLKFQEKYKALDISLDWNSPEFKKIKDDLFINKLNFNLDEEQVRFVLENFSELKNYQQLTQAEFDNIKLRTPEEIDLALNVPAPLIPDIKANLPTIQLFQRIPDIDIPNLQYTLELGIGFDDLLPLIQAPNLSLDLVLPVIQPLGITYPQFQEINLPQLRRLDFLGVDFATLTLPVIEAIAPVIDLPDFPNIDFNLLIDFDRDFLNRINLDLIEDIELEIIKNIDFENPFSNLDFILDGYAVLPVPFGFGLDFSLPGREFKLISPLNDDFKDYTKDFISKTSFSSGALTALEELGEIPEVPTIPDTLNPEVTPPLNPQPSFDIPNVSEKNIQPIFSFIINIISMPIQFVIEVFKTALDKTIGMFKLWEIPSNFKDLATFEFVTDFLKKDKILEFLNISLNLEDMSNFYEDIKIPLLNMPDINDIDLPTILVQLKNHVLTIPSFISSIFKLIEGVINSFIKMPTKVIGLPDLPNINILSQLKMEKLVAPIIENINFLDKLNTLDITLSNLRVENITSTFDTPNLNINNIRGIFDTRIPNILVNLPNVKLDKFKLLLENRIPTLRGLNLDFPEIPNILLDMKLDFLREFHFSFERNFIPDDELRKIPLSEIPVLPDEPRFENIPRVIPQTIEAPESITLYEIKEFTRVLSNLDLLDDTYLPDFSVNEIREIQNVSDLEAIVPVITDFETPPLTIPELEFKLEEQRELENRLDDALSEVRDIKKKVNFKNGFNFDKFDLSRLNFEGLGNLSIPTFEKLDIPEFNLDTLKKMLPNVNLPELPGIPGIDAPSLSEFNVELGIPTVQFNLGIELPTLNLTPLELNDFSRFPRSPYLPNDANIAVAC